MAALDLRIAIFCLQILHLLVEFALPENIVAVR